jgi:NDP-hexose-3-ketoreductase
MKKINIGIIGCSSIANKTVLPVIKSNSLFNLVKVGSRSIEKGKIFADKFNCAYGTYEDVLKDPIIDAIYVSVPSGLHYEWGKKVVEAGKHLLLEKPFTDTYEHSKNIIDIAEKNNLIAMEGLVYVYHPYYIKLKELIDQGTIGKVRLIESSFGFPYLPDNDVRNMANIGGGAILDNLIYPLSVSLDILGGQIENINYNIIYDDRLKVDKRGFLRIDYPDSAANITYGFGFYYKNTIDIWGSEGMISIDRAFTKPFDMSTEIVLKKDYKTQTISVEPANQFLLMLDAFYNKIVSGNDGGKNEKSDILKRMKIISELYLSTIK